MIADEPTSALDPSVQAKILKLLMNLQDRMGLAMIFITHDIALARKISDRMAVMHRGRIVEEGKTNEILMCPSHPYTRKLVDCALGRNGNECGPTSDAGLMEAGRSLAEFVSEPEEQPGLLEKYC